MKIHRLYTLLILGSIFSVNSYAANDLQSSSPIQISAPAKDTCVPGDAKSSYNYNATKWYRDSAEKNAQYNQIFSIGLEKVTAKVKQENLKHKNWGVILDIDETVLDNSAYEKNSVLSCQNYTSLSNYTFMEQKISTATPGASKFTCSVQKMGGKVVLVTNRDGTFDDKIKQSTVDNLKQVGICFDNVVFANGGSDNDKTPRFNAVIAGNYESIIAVNKLKPVKVIAYFGDNIQDFPNVKQSEAIKQDPNSDFYSKFGQEYFSLPNPTYGSWEKNQFN